MDRDIILREEEKRMISVICEVIGVDRHTMINNPQRVKGVGLFGLFILTHELVKYGRSHIDIAKFMGKNHATIAYYLKRYDDELETNRMFRDIIEDVALLKHIPYLRID